MNVAIISDTHMPRGARALPGACVERLRAADVILHAGDLIRTSVLDELERLGPPLHAISGNVDDADVRRRVPPRAVIELDGVRIGMIHDPGPSRGRFERLGRQFPETDAVVFGHTHMPEHEKGSRPAGPRPPGDVTFQIFNPGSPTERRRAPNHTMGMATIAGGAITFELVVLG